MPAISDARILIIATHGFEQSELMTPLRQLREQGARVEIATPDAQTIRGWKDKDWGDPVDADLSLADVEIDRYDALVLPGGVLNPDQLRQNDDAVGIVREANRLGLPVAAICHGPWMLIEADIVEGAQVTSWPSLQTDLENAGAFWTDEQVVVDENIITSRKPDDLDAFVQAIVAAVSAPAEAEAD